MKDFNETLSEVRAKIAASCARVGRDVSEVEIIAVTKTHGAETVDEAWRAGLSIVGENKVQEAEWKKAASASGPSWHLIGHLQTNKVRRALEIFDFIHSVDSVRLADRIQLVADDIGSLPHILLEVNVAGESSKSGMKIEEVRGVLEYISEHCPRITVEGLMTMAPFSENPEDSRVYFRKLRELRDSLERDLGIALPRLSMGMSGDYEVAVEEGATWLRLGTVLFGDRPKVTAKISPMGLDSYSGEGPVVRVLD
jgi:pyridoxal phosphate enzyme (YggS family)